MNGDEIAQAVERAAEEVGLSEPDHDTRVSDALRVLAVKIRDHYKYLREIGPRSLPASPGGSTIVGSGEASGRTEGAMTATGARLV